MARAMFDIDSHAVAEHVNRLDKMHRSALPNAIRGTLNGMAYFTKKTSMPMEARRAFVNRDPNFFKAKSRVENARGWNVDTMRATVGFIGNDQAVEDLEKQEYGGIIKGRAFIPTDIARTGKTNRKKVARRNRLSKMGNVVRVSKSHGKTAGERFIRSAVHVGVGGYLLRGNELLQVKSLSRKSRSSWNIKTELLYTYKKGRTIKVKPTQFMHRATMTAASQGNRIFHKEAERQINRLR
jgi:hypothetical protein